MLLSLSCFLRKCGNTKFSLRIKQSQSKCSSVLIICISFYILLDFKSLRLIFDRLKMHNNSVLLLTNLDTSADDDPLSILSN